MGQPTGFYECENIPGGEPPLPASRFGLSDIHRIPRNTNDQPLTRYRNCGLLGSHKLPPFALKYNSFDKEQQ
jgi:hypothetical protein